MTSDLHTTAILPRARTRYFSWLPVGALVSLLAGGAAAGGDPTAAFVEIEETYGHVPGFFWLFDVDQVAPTWDAIVTLQMNSDISLAAGTRELISVAIAAQGDCQTCVYFHAAAAFANGASPSLILEAIGIGAATQRLDAALSNAQADFRTFSAETDLLLWGDAQSVERQGPPAGFCAFVSTWAGVGHTGCDDR